MNKDFFIHESSFINENSIVGKETKIWHFCNIMEYSEIGKNCNIGQNVVICPNVKIGNGVKIQNNVSIYTGVLIEDNVFIGPSVVFTNVINPRSFINRKSEFKQTIIKKGCSIGANSTIICGINIGDFCLIGAGSVVTKDVKNFALVVGNPAKQIGWVSEHGHRLDFINNIAICKESNKKYILKSNHVNICDI